MSESFLVLAHVLVDKYLPVNTIHVTEMAERKGYNTNCVVMNIFWDLVLV